MRGKLVALLRHALGVASLSTCLPRSRGVLAPPPVRLRHLEDIGSFEHTGPGPSTVAISAGKPYSWSTRPRIGSGKTLRPLSAQPVRLNSKVFKIRTASTSELAPRAETAKRWTNGWLRSTDETIPDRRRYPGIVVGERRDCEQTANRVPWANYLPSHPAARKPHWSTRATAAPWDGGPRATGSPESMQQVSSVRQPTAPFQGPD
jgi:hypothetical protein